MSRWLCLFLLSLVVAGCGETTEGPDDTTFVSAPSQLSFGEVALGHVAQGTLSIHNHSVGVVRLQVEDVPRGFHLPDHPTHEILLQPRGTTDVSIAFMPRETGPAGGTLVLGARSRADERIEVRLEGVGVVNEISVEGDLDFGLVPVGESKTLPLHVQSTTDGTILIGMDKGVEVFQVATGAVQVQAGQRVTLEITFTPLVQGPHHTYLLLSTCAWCRPQVVSLRGEGGVQSLRPEPSRMDFGSVLPGWVQFQTLQLFNTGNMSVDVESVVLTEDTDPAFVLEAFVGTIGPWERETLYVSFAPSEFGEKEGGIRFYGAGGVLLFEVPLFGRAGGKALEASPEEVDFGVLPPGAEALQVVTLSNRSGAPVHIEEMGLADPSGRFRFRLRGGATTIRADGRAEIEVFYAASTDSGGVGAHEARLSVQTHEAIDGPLVISLRGRTADLGSCDGLVSPGPVRLGLVPDVGRIERRLQWVNEGDEPCGILDVHLEPEGSPAFRLEGRPDRGVALAPGSTLEMTLVFDPTEEPVDQLKSTAIVASLADGGTQRVDAGAFPSSHRIRVTPEAIEFGGLPRDYERPLAVAVSNIGGAAVPVERVVPGPEDPGFRVEVGENLPGSLDVGQKERLVVSYRNTVPGKVRGNLEIWIEGAPEPFLVPMRAEGLDKPCGALCEAPVPICPPDEPIVIGREHVLEGQVVGGEGAASCHWTVAHQPWGTRSSPPTSTGPCSATFTPDMAGTYVIQMRVTEGEATAICITQLEARFAEQGIRFETHWEKASDVDVHVLPPGVDPLIVTSWMGEQALFSGAPGVDGRPTRQWGSATAWLDWNDTTGTGPENPRIENPVPGARYAVGVHWNQAMGHGSTWVTTNVLCGGILAGSATVELDTEKQFIFLGDIQHNGIAGCVWRSNHQSWLTGP